MFLIFSLFIFAVVIFSFDKSIKLKDKIFKCRNGYGRISFVQILKKIIEKKLNNVIECERVVSKQKFFGLNLIYAPVYVLDAKLLGSSHLRLYKKAVELVKRKMNLVILDGMLTVENTLINVVCLKSNKMNFAEIALLNKLNVNKHMQYKELEKNNNMIDKKDFITTKFANGVGIIQVNKKTKFKLNIPYDCFGFLFKGQRNKTTICNIFGDKVYEIKGKFNAKSNYSSIDFSVNNPNNIIVSFERFELREILLLLTLDLKFEEYYQEINNLRLKAISELNNNFFAIEKELKCFNIESLKDFFKLANLRQTYFNDYLFLITKIFGISIKKGVLNVKPKNFIQQGFVVSYSLNDEEYNVYFDNKAYDKVKLSSVGHKLGVRENFVYDF